jgi:hypothetical protein
MKDTVNSVPLWGFPRRCVKLSNFSVEVKYYGTCQVYYARSLDLEINAVLDPATGAVKSGWDRDLLDEATKVLHGRFLPPEQGGRYEVLDINGQPPSRFNPEHFDRFLDRQGEPSTIVLNGEGLPAEVVVGPDPIFAAIDAASGADELPTNANFWVPYVGAAPTAAGVITPIAYETDRAYVRGNVVKPTVGAHTTKTYVVMADHRTPAVIAQRDDQITNNLLPLQLLGNDPYTPTVGAEWSPATAYGIGQFVRYTVRTSAGTIHVEKYPESDFTVLGIPLVF